MSGTPNATSLSDSGSAAAHAGAWKEKLGVSPPPSAAGFRITAATNIAISSQTLTQKEGRKSTMQASQGFATADRAVTFTRNPANIRRAVTAATIGTVIEWYDYALYGAASGLIINKLFFPQFSAVGGVLAAFATFAVGFFMRPLGGIVIAH